MSTDAELTAARSLLGVTATDSWAVIRATYRTQIRKSHPDVAGEDATERAADLNAAYRTLARAHREGHRTPTINAPTAEWPTNRRPAPVHADWVDGPDVQIVGGDTLVFHDLPSHAFARVVEAASRLGSVSYLDRSAAILEAVLALEDGHHASLVVSLQWRAHDATCEAFCTLEALDRAEHLDVSGVLEQLVALLPPQRS